MSWNYRVMATDYKGEIIFQVHEVYYDENGKPEGYTENPISISGESVEDVKETLKKIEDGCGKPVLWADDRFPGEYK